MLHPCESVIGALQPFLDEVVDCLEGLGLPVRDLEMDHVCYRCASVEEYLYIKNCLVPFGHALEEGMIGGRPILTFLLSEPIIFRGHWLVSCLEIPCPKPGRAYSSGLEHVEIALCAPGAVGPDGRHVFVDSRPILEEFMLRHPDVKFDTRAIDKDINADVSVQIREGVSVKYHARPLRDVCAFEIAGGLTQPVPSGYFGNNNNATIV